MKLPIDYDKLHWKDRKLVREEYIRLQNGRCCYCGNLLEEKPINEVLISEIDESLFPPTFFKHPVHLHHDHNTGLTIGAIHNRCNAFLWQYHGEYRRGI